MRGVRYLLNQFDPSAEQSERAAAGLRVFRYIHRNMMYVTSGQMDSLARAVQQRAHVTHIDPALEVYPELMSVCCTLCDRLHSYLAEVAHPPPPGQEGASTRATPRQEGEGAEGCIG